MSDSIRRQDAIDEFETYFDHIKRIDKRGHKYIKPIELDVKEIINTLPSAEKHGEWRVVSDGYGNGEATANICECSICGDTVWVYKDAERKWNYCPNCGTRMRGAE